METRDDIEIQKSGLHRNYEALPSAARSRHDNIATILHCWDIAEGTHRRLTLLVSTADGSAHTSLGMMLACSLRAGYISSSMAIKSV